MKVKFLGTHNTESGRTHMSSILVDDIFALDAGGLTSRLSFRAQTKLQALFITHQHFDHIRDIPSLAMNLYLRDKTIDVFAPRPVYSVLKERFSHGDIYPNFLDPVDGKQVINFHFIEPYRTISVANYRITAVPVVHPVPAVGYQVNSSKGESLFYTGDTGPGLYECWHHVNPNLLIIEISAPSRFSEDEREAGHLTPQLLKDELTAFKEVKHYLPDVIAVHVNPELENEIRQETAELAAELGIDLKVAREGMVVHLGEN
jgi:ribonuclease BN (tRNA processing enzyme)